MQKKILVTGGAGFIGSNFVRHIYKKYPDYKIIVLDALTYAGSIENLPININENSDERLAFWYGNVKNGELVDTLISQSDVVVHFAAETHVTRSIYDNFLFFETDVLGTQTIANAVLKYKDRIERFIHISTSEVYGTARKEFMDEEHPLMPMSPYASAKAGADRLVYSYWATYEIPAIIIRPFNNYGPYQHLEKAVPRFVTSCILNEPIRVHGDGGAARDYIFVEDACMAIDMAMHADIKKVRGEVFNVASGIHRSILSLAQEVVRLMGKDESIITFVGERPGQVFRHTGDITKIRKTLRWNPTVSFEDGLKKTILWYKENRKWWERQLWMRAVPIITKSGKVELH
ncbi:MAG: epimerase [Deltaproteobacteria bacterium GWC2_42_51]|nr:MAG: epimerase [Deltaproteobacteria bacterium GWA2_42_85]OGP27324.1 MAG: epimerase [Deltaproteobacteria bacterium GWB2_42_7]OGP32358.1 MAG: epimerase [Deltaproteobacteria bacterium GWC2_42_51]OGP38532.1 MAG: epimerase [Deltaproteobacteria bacterium GWD2_42_10]OGP48091.1 MAG: epimerase [Deltaproteobacteria bacterium GWF2_42_12]OGQ24828.1 MAG: epimerase [Deltaproteobacteria bacterium RIFCSPHIGHO2_02_FULL_42_44]OGQ36742.1 MAG: epimerase [Deltaproteobacteria bacterium RIFCSPLOWO2_02_FULL_42_39